MEEEKGRRKGLEEKDGDQKRRRGWKKRKGWKKRLEEVNGR